MKRRSLLELQPWQREFLHRVMDGKRLVRLVLVTPPRRRLPPVEPPDDEAVTGVG